MEEEEEEQEGANKGYCYLLADGVELGYVWHFVKMKNEKLEMKDRIDMILALSGFVPVARGFYQGY